MRIALSGYYGCGNTGDEAVLAGIARSFELRAPAAAQLTVLSADPNDTLRRHGLSAVNRMDMAAVRQLLQNSDLLVSGGGSLLQDTTSVRSLIYYLWVMRMAAKCAKPFMLYAQGIGPLRRPVSRLVTRMVVNRAAYITVRDGESAQLLRDIGVTRPQIEVTADPAFALQPVESARAKHLLQNAGADITRPLVGVALRPWQGSHDAVAAYAHMVDRIVKELGAQAVFVPLQPPGDLDLSRQVAHALGSDGVVVCEPLSHTETLGVVNELSLLCAMRLHALIFGAMCAKPLLALSYDPKVSSLMAGLHQAEYTVDVKEFDVNNAVARAQQAYGQRLPISAHLREVAAERLEATLRNVDRALALA